VHFAVLLLNRIIKSKQLSLPGKIREIYISCNEHGTKPNTGGIFMRKPKRKNCYGKWMDNASKLKYAVTMETDYEIAFQSNIVKLRCRAGLTQEELADLLGVSRNAVAKWEAGNGIPSVRNLITLSRLLGVSIDAMLLGSVDEKED